MMFHRYASDPLPKMLLQQPVNDPALGPSPTQALGVVMEDGTFGGSGAGAQDAEVEGLGDALLEGGGGADDGVLARVGGTGELEADDATRVGDDEVLRSEGREHGGGRRGVNLALVFTIFLIIASSRR